MSVGNLLAPCYFIIPRAHTHSFSGTTSWILVVPVLFRSGLSLEAVGLNILESLLPCAFCIASSYKANAHALSSNNKKRCIVHAYITCLRTHISELEASLDTDLAPMPYYTIRDVSGRVQSSPLFYYQSSGG